MRLESNIAIIFNFQLSIYNECIILNFQTMICSKIESLKIIENCKLQNWIFCHSVLKRIYINKIIFRKSKKLMFKLMFFDRCVYCQIDKNQHSKNQRLNQADDDFQKHKRNGNTKSQDGRHRCEQYFAGENITEKTEWKTRDFGQFTNDFHQTHKQFNRIDN